MRGADIPYNPMFRAYAIVKAGENQTHRFVTTHRLQTTNTTRFGVVCF